MSTVSDLPSDLARRIRIVLLDADGVLSDRGIYVADGTVGEPAPELRRFDVRDGLAVHILRRAGIGVAVVSARASPAVRERARSLGIEEVHQVGPLEKLPAARGVLARAGVTWEEAAFVGDDLPDLPLLRRVGLPAAPADAAPEVRATALWVTRAPGGRGAVREFVEALLRARGEWEALLEGYLAACEAADREAVAGAPDPGAVPSAGEERRGGESRRG